MEGEFNAIMAVVMPCRSDRSDSGLAPFAHMADGIIHLILVRKCTVLQVLHQPVPEYRRKLPSAHGIRRLHRHTHT